LKRGYQPRFEKADYIFTQTLQDESRIQNRTVLHAREGDEEEADTSPFPRLLPGVWAGGGSLPVVESRAFGALPMAP
jgi:hypothetical protein